MEKKTNTTTQAEKAAKTENKPHGVFAKILELQKRVRALKKDEKSYGYDYLSGDKLFEVVRPAMDELGLLLLPNIKSMTLEPVKYTLWDRNAKAMVEKTENMCVIDVTFTWVDVEANETLEQSWRGTGQNGFDKSFGSALTYAERYFLLKTFHIATNRDDVDAIAAARDEAVEKAGIEAAAKAEAEKKAAADNMPPAGTPVVKPRFASLEELKKDNEFWQWTEAAAIGKKTRNGNDARPAWITKYHPTPEQIKYFDDMVANKKAIVEMEQNGEAAQ